jgi:hypothetical protein
MVGAVLLYVNPMSRFRRDPLPVDYLPYIDAFAAEHNGRFPDFVELCMIREAIASTRLDKDPEIGTFSVATHQEGIT